MKSEFCHPYCVIWLGLGTIGKTLWSDIDGIGGACQQTTKLATKDNKMKRTRIRKNTVVTKETGKDQGKN